VDDRVELSLINKHVRQHNREAGESVFWFEFVPFADSASAGSVYDDIYNEGPPGVGGRSYSGGLVVPCIYINENEDLFTAMEDGRQPTQNIILSVLFEDMRQAGVQNPDEYNSHLNDIFFYDQRYYKVRDYHVRGRLPSEVVIGIEGYEVMVEQEFPFDPGPPTLISQNLPWPNSFPVVSV
jgi:hypothetical protein